MEQNTLHLKTGRIIAHYRGKYRVGCGNRELWASVTGKKMFLADSQHDFPVVGDNVKITETGEDSAVINEILPRKSIIERKAAGKDLSQPIAANVNTAFIVEAVDRDFNLNRYERYMAIASAGKIRPVLILNKSDLLLGGELKIKTALIEERFKGVPLIITSILAEDGMGSLVKAVKKGEIHCFLGSSGVGKSSLINKLLGQEMIKTKEISIKTKKGKHTTTHRELFTLKNGGMVIDNPGMREVGLADAKEGVKNVFSDIEKLGKTCRFADCTHIHEPGCAVLDALASGGLSQEKYDNYLKLKKEADHYAMTSLEKRNKDRGFGRMVKKVMKFKKKNK